ncbi:MAG: polysaccharide deacetylase family protein [Clostridia bacterium]|nr:polysaccharide deacetylase family protein [Clostridia bacterium]
MKVLFIKKAIIKVVISVIAFLCIFAVNQYVLPVSAVYFNSTKRLLPIYSVETEEEKLAISFDAAWGADKTREIMNICDSYNVKATFFLVGFWVDEYPDMVKEIYNRGYEVGIHSDTHPDMTKLSKKEIKQELETNISKIEELTGCRPKLFRPPYGYYNDELIEVCDDLDIKCIEWSVDSLDWKGLGAGEISGRVTSRADKGDIVLFHNNSDNILPALKSVLEYYKLKKINIVPIGELIYYENYEINHQGTQIKK